MYYRNRKGKVRKTVLNDLKQTLKGNRWSGEYYFQYCVPNVVTYIDSLNCCYKCRMFMACKYGLLENFGEVLK